jgi:hypothetical protein
MENIIYFSDNFGEQKAVQLYVKDKPFLALHSELKHGKILDKFLEEFEIPFLREANFHGNFHAKLCGEDYTVVGMSKVDISRSGFYFFGKSFGFNIGYNIRHIMCLKDCTCLNLDF